MHDLAPQTDAQPTGTATPALARDPHGRLVLQLQDGTALPVVPVRAFPLSAADEGIALVGPDGSEHWWIEQLADLPDDARALIQEELASRACTPAITRILQVSSRATPSTWQVETDRGATSLTLKAEEDIRRLPGGALLIADAHGLSFLVRRTADLDKPSRRLLDHFL